MKSNYDGSEYGQVTVGRGKAVHFGNSEDNMTACGKRGYLSDASGCEVTCKVCVKMAETTHDGSAPLIKDTPEAHVAPAPTADADLTGSQRAALRLIAENGGSATVRKIAQAVSGDAQPRASVSKSVQGVLRSLVQHGRLIAERGDGPVVYRPVPLASEPTQTFEVTYLAPRTGTQRVERVEATTVHTVPVAPRDAEVLLSVYLVTKESALLDLTAAAADAHTKSALVGITLRGTVQRAAAHDAWRLACRREDLASLRASQMGATAKEKHVATLAGIRQVDPNY